MPKPIIAIQMDDFDNINYSTDTTILLATELQNRDLQIFCYTPNNLIFDGSKLQAKGCYVNLFEDEQKFYEIQKTDLLDLEKADLVLIRQNPPFDINYITNTYLLEKLHGKTLVLNNPKAIRDNPEKLMIYHFPKYILPSVIGSNLEMLKEFYSLHQDVMIKPLYNFGGNEIKRISSHEDLQKTLSSYIKEHEQIVMQKFLPSVFNGDKRILMADGEVVGALKRIPASGSVTSNLAAGGKAAITDLTDKEIEVASTVGKFLKSNDLFLAGIDILDGCLLEINITSPTGYKSYNKLYNTQIERRIVDSLLKKVF